ncbi:MAG: cysteine desulfurase family protein [Candidatus Nanopelagicales bacterium]
MPEPGPVYLDHNATTPVAPEVAKAMWPYLVEHFGNPSSDHAFGRAARAGVDLAREQVAALIGARPEEIVFTSGGTEANNLAIRGSSVAAHARVAVTTAVEHPASTAPLGLLAAGGWRVDTLPVDRDGRADPAAIPDGPIGLASVILAQNEVGTIQPVAAIAEASHRAGGLVHADAAQAVGKIDVEVDAIGIDLLSIAGHKLYAPKGVGALYVRRGTPMSPLLVGAAQEHGLRPGTENVAGIVGLGAACALAGDLLAAEPARQEVLREGLWTALAASIPGLVRLSPAQGCLPNTLTIALPGRIGADILAAAPGVAASTGSACHAGTHTPSATMLAMGVDPIAAVGALRLTLGRATTVEDVRTAAQALAHAITIA